MKVKLTKKFIDDLPLTESGYKIYPDEALTGFALYVGTKSKRYILNRRINKKMYRTLVDEVHMTTLTAAREKATAMMVNIRQGLHPYEGLHELPEIEDEESKAPQVPTLLEAYNYFKEMKSELSDGTITTYDRQILGKLSDWLDKPLNDITKAMISKKHKEISANSKAQANATMRALRSVWNYCRDSFLDENEDFIIKEQPIKILNAKKDWNNIKPRTRHVAEENLGQFFKTLLKYTDRSSHMQAPHSNNARDLMLMFMLTGVRLNEGQNLEWSDVDLDNGYIVFRDTKNGSDYDMPLGKILAALLKERKRLSDGSRWVFPSSQRNTDGPITDLTRSYKRIGELNGMYITPHDLRRTFGTVANSLNINYPVLKRLLNHRETKATDDVTLQYVQVSQKQLRTALNQIEKLYCKQAEMTQDEVIAKLI